MPAPALNLIDKIYFKLASVFVDDIGRIKAIAQKVNSSTVNLAIVPKVVIRGHTCDAPIVTAVAKATWGTNDKLSVGRAEAVAKLLIAAGVRDDLIRIEGRGETLPTSNDRDVNRRVEIFIEEV